MRKAILVVIASSLPIAAMAAGERDIEHGSVASRMEPAVSFEVRGRGERTEDSGRSAASLRQVTMPRSASVRLDGAPPVSAATSGSAAASAGATMSAPEIDPTSAASGLTLLLGGMAVLRGRKASAEKR